MHADWEHAELMATTRGNAPEPTSCPACGSDDYDTEPGPDGLPDYEHGVKTCQDCGEQWV